MVSNAFYKAIAGLAGAGIVTTGAYGIYESFNRGTISDKVLEDKLTPLDTRETSTSSTNLDDSTWKTKVGAWVEKEGVARFVGKSLKSESESEKVSALKERCRQALEEVYKRQKYEDFKSYCTSQNQY